MRKLVLVAVALTSAMASGLLAVGPAAAAAPDLLKITISPTLTSPADQSAAATLTCDPVGGTHKYAAEACADIAAAKGVIAAIPPRAGMACLPVWRPVEIKVTGVWKGLLIDFSETQTDISCAHIAHGYVFNI
jgi:hypothetical protein